MENKKWAPSEEEIFRVNNECISIHKRRTFRTSKRNWMSRFIYL